MNSQSLMSSMMNQNKSQEEDPLMRLFSPGTPSPVIPKVPAVKTKGQKSAEAVLTKARTGKKNENPELAKERKRVEKTNIDPEGKKLLDSWVYMNQYDSRGVTFGSEVDLEERRIRPTTGEGLLSHYKPIEGSYEEGLELIKTPEGRARIKAQRDYWRKFRNVSTDNKETGKAFPQSPNSIGKPLESSSKDKAQTTLFDVRSEWEDSKENGSGVMGFLQQPKIFQKVRDVLANSLTMTGNGPIIEGATGLFGRILSDNLMLGLPSLEFAGDPSNPDYDRAAAVVEFGSRMVPVARGLHGFQLDLEDFGKMMNKLAMSVAKQTGKTVPEVVNLIGDTAEQVVREAGVTPDEINELFDIHEFTKNLRGKEGVEKPGDPLNLIENIDRSGKRTAALETPEEEAARMFARQQWLKGDRGPRTLTPIEEARIGQVAPDPLDVPSKPVADPAPVETPPASEKLSIPSIHHRPDGVDEPITVTGILGEKGGRTYVSIEGSNTGVPLDEIIITPESIAVRKADQRAKLDPQAYVDETPSTPEAPTATVDPPVTTNTPDAPEAPVRQPQGAIEPTSERPYTVTSNGKTYRVDDPDIIAEHRQLAADHARAIDNLKLMGGREESIKALGMQHSANVRKLLGAHTPKEASNIMADSQKIRVGAIVDAGKLGKARVLKNPAFGKVDVELLEDGAIVRLEHGDLTPEPPQTPGLKPGVSEYALKQTDAPVRPPRETVEPIEELRGRARIEAARARMAARGKNLPKNAGGSPLTGEDLADIIDVGKGYIEEGVDNVSDFIEKVVSAVGEWARPHVKAVWEYLNDAEPQTGAFGLATKFQKPGVESTGYRDVVDLAERGKRIVFDDPEAPARVYKSAGINNTLSEDDIAVVAFRGTQLINKHKSMLSESLNPALDDAERGLIIESLADIESEMVNVKEVSDIARAQFHRTGQALQVAFAKDYSPASIRAEAMIVNFGESPPPSFTVKLNRYMDNLEEAEEAAREAVKNLGDKVKKEKAPSTTFDKGKTVERLKSKLNLGKIADESQGRTRGGKTSGAFQVPKGKEASIAKDVNALVRGYVKDGASSLDDVVREFINDFPMMNKDDVLMLMSGEYKAAVLTADVQKLQIDKALRRLREQAKFQRQSKGVKFLKVSEDAVLGLAKSLQSGLDLSLSFIQGMPGLISAPGKWGEAWVPWFKTTFAKPGGAPFATALENVRLSKDPGFKFAKKAGVHFLDFSGLFGIQEEVLLGNIVEAARENAPPVVKQYFELLARSQEGGAAFLNKLRLELFKKFTGGNFTDKKVLDDAAVLTNIITGRGHGKVAAMLSARPMAYVGYAPRFLWSKFQNSALPLLMPTVLKSSQGRKAAASVWSKQQVVSMLAAPLIAKSLGLEVDLDLRKAYGTITLPNGGKLRMFKHINEPLDILYKLRNGKIARNGKLTKPGYGSGTIAQQYAQGKMSPTAATAWAQLTDNKFNRETGKGEKFNLLNPKDLGRSLYEQGLTFSTQNAIESIKSGDPMGIFLGLLGIDYIPARGKTTTANERN